MNTTNTTQEVIYYVRVSTNNPSIMLGLAHLGKESPFSVAEGMKIFFTKNWDYRLANGDLIALNITVVDEDKEAKENKEEITVYTTKNQLAVELGKKIAAAHKGGKLEIQWSKTDKPVEVRWHFNKK